MLQKLNSDRVRFEIQYRRVTRMKNLRLCEGELNSYLVYVKWNGRIFNGEYLWVRLYTTGQ